MSERSELTELAQYFSDIGDQNRLEQTLDKLEGLPADSPSTVDQDFSGSVMEKKDNKYLDANVSPREFILNSVKKAVGNNARMAGFFKDIFNLTGDVQQYPKKVLGLKGAPDYDRSEKFTDMRRFGEMSDASLGTDNEMLPPDETTRLIGKGIEFAGSSIVPSGVVAGMAKNTGRALALEGTGIVGGAVGSEVGGNVTESAHSGRATGEIIGGITGALPAPAIVGAVKGGKSLYKGGSKYLSSKGGKRIKGIVDAEELGKNIEDSNKVAEAIENVTGAKFEPTLAGRTRSDVVGDVQDQVLGADIGTAERAISTHKDNVKTLKSYMDKAVPDSKLGIGRIADEKKRKTLISLDKASERLATQRRLLTERTGGKDVGKQQPIGEQLSAKRDLNKQREQTKLADRMENIYSQAKEEGISVDMGKVSKFVKGVAKSEGNSFQNMPPVFKKVLDTKGKASFKKLHSLWRETNNELDTALKAGNPKANHLKALKDRLKKEIDSFEEGGSKAATEFRKWNEDYGAYAKTYKEGVGGRIDPNALGKFGDIVEPEDVVKKFFTPKGIDDFNRIYKNDAYAKKLLEDGILDKFALESGMTTGDMKPWKVDAFLKNNKEALKKLPDLKKKLHNSTKVGELLLEKANRIAEAKTQISNGILSQIAKTNNVDKVIDTALSNPKYLRQLMTTGEEGRKAVIHSLTTAIPRAAAKNKMTISEYMDANEKILRPLLNKYSTKKQIKDGVSHYENVKIAMKGMDMVLSGRPPKHPSLTFLNQDPIEALTGTGMPSLISQYRATHITRQSSPIHMASTALSKFWIKTLGKSAHKVQEYLLTNPQAARDFALATKSKEMGILSNRISNHLLSAGVRAVTGASEELIREDK